MIASLIRFPNSVETPGKLSCPGFSCDSLELLWRNNQHQISCIPTGTYSVSWGHMVTKNKDHYQVNNVPGRSAIFIHAGNYASGNHPDILGCLLLGRGFADINHDGTADILNSKVTLQEFEDLLNKQPFTLVITDSTQSV